MTEIAATSEAPSEARVLAGELANSFGKMVQMYEKHFSLSREEAVHRATEPLLDHHCQRVLNGPPDEVSWCDLHMIARTDSDRATARWEELKKAALDEVRTGHRAAKATDTYDGAWQRAQFLALREELSVEWRPRNGIERQLLDTMAQAQTGYLTWLRNLTIRTNLESCTNDRRLKEEGRWESPRQSDADALDHAAAMMDRFNRILLRTLRALCDMRRHSNPVIVQNGGQMNLAHQQVNLGTATSAGVV